MKFSKSLLDEIKNKIEISDVVGKRKELKEVKAEVDALDKNEADDKKDSSSK
jgi:DNA primase